jgi:isopenicillin-N epimerase
LRENYLLDPSVVFLNHGSFGACPKTVFERYQAWQLELERQPVEFLGRRYQALIRESLTTLGEFIGTSGENLMFVPNATVGLNTVARSMRLKAGDEILTSNHEYGALKLTWDFIARETGAVVKAMPLNLPFLDEAAIVEKIWAGVTKKTKILFLSHITSPTALIFPVKELCRRAREAGIISIIDGAHVAGHLPLNLDDFGADFYSSNLHKWLSAPKGAAFLYVNPKYHDLIDPLTISWGWDGTSLFERTNWQGTRDVSAYLTVPDAIKFQQEHDWWTLSAQCHDLAIAAMHRICELVGLPPVAMPRFFGQMVIAPLPKKTDLLKLKAELYEQFRVEVPLTQHDGQPFVRVSIQAYNTREDSDVLLKGLKALL